MELLSLHPYRERLVSSFISLAWSLVVLKGARGGRINERVSTHSLSVAALRGVAVHSAVPGGRTGPGLEGRVGELDPVKAESSTGQVSQGSPLWPLGATDQI